MMKSITLLLAVAFTGMSAAVVNASGWTITSKAEGHESVLKFDGFSSRNTYYLFSCESNGLLIIETGVTELLDLQTGHKVGDSPEAEMPEGSATLALFTDRTEPKFVPATAAHNAVNGWDLRATVPLNSSAVRGLLNAKAMSLMTTGWTGLVELSPGDRKLIYTFLDGCKRS